VKQGNCHFGQLSPVKSFLTAIFISVSLCGLADGMLVLANVGAGANAPINDWDGTNELFGPTFAADLYYGPLGTTDPALLTPLRQPTPFYTNGYFLGGERVIPGYPFGLYITVQVRVWDAPDGDSYEAVLNSTSPTARVGESALFPALLDWPPGSTFPLTGLTPFKMVPIESNPPARPLPAPLTVVIGSTNRLVFSWPSCWLGWTFALQQNTSLTGSNWLTLTNTPMLSGSQSQVVYQVDIPSPSGRMFYRLLSK
jgi:hypothetical protein